MGVQVSPRANRIKMKSKPKKPQLAVCRCGYVMSIKLMDCSKFDGCPQCGGCFKNFNIQLTAEEEERPKLKVIKGCKE